MTEVRSKRQLDHSQSQSWEESLTLPTWQPTRFHHTIPAPDICLPLTELSKDVQGRSPHAPSTKCSKQQSPLTKDVQGCSLYTPSTKCSKQQASCWPNVQGRFLPPLIDQTSEDVQGHFPPPPLTECPKTFKVVFRHLSLTECPKMFKVIVPMCHPPNVQSSRFPVDWMSKVIFCHLSLTKRLKMFKVIFCHLHWPNVQRHSRLFSATSHWPNVRRCSRSFSPCVIHQMFKAAGLPLSECPKTFKVIFHHLSLTEHPKTFKVVLSMHHPPNIQSSRPPPFTKYPKTFKAVLPCHPPNVQSSKPPPIDQMSEDVQGRFSLHAIHQMQASHWPNVWRRSRSFFTASHWPNCPKTFKVILPTRRPKQQGSPSEDVQASLCIIHQRFEAADNRPPVDRTSEDVQGHFPPPDIQYQASCRKNRPKTSTSEWLKLKEEKH